MDHQVLGAWNGPLRCRHAPWLVILRGSATIRRRGSLSILPQGTPGEQGSVPHWWMTCSAMWGSAMSCHHGVERWCCDSAVCFQWFYYSSDNKWERETTKATNGMKQQALQKQQRRLRESTKKHVEEQKHRSIEFQNRNSSCGTKLNPLPLFLFLLGAVEVQPRWRLGGAEASGGSCTTWLKELTHRRGMIETWNRKKGEGRPGQMVIPSYRYSYGII